MKNCLTFIRTICIQPLSRMEKKGYVDSRWGDDTEERSGARKRYYRLTGLGERVLNIQQESLLLLWGLEGKVRV